MDLTGNEFDVLNKEDFATLHDEYKATGSIRIRNKLVNTNMKLVVSMANKMAYTHDDVDDLISCGTIGLISAIDRFDTSTSNKFGTFAADWIKHEMRLFLDDTNKTVRLPKNQRVKVSKLSKLNNKYDNTDIAISEYNKTAKTKINNAEYAFINGVLNYKTSTIYMSNDEGNNFLNPELTDKIDNTTNSDYNLLFNESNTELLLSMKKILTKEELIVVSLRYGINQEYMLRFPDIAKKLKVCSNTVKTIYNNALTKLKENKSLLM